MSEPIKVGDLVQVVRGHVCDLGNLFTVRFVHNSTTGLGWWCDQCGALETCDESLAAGGPEDYGAPLSWLKRIPPFPELKDEKHDEEITA